MPAILVTAFLMAAMARSTAAPPTPPTAVAKLGAGVEASRAGDHDGAIKALRRALAGALRNRDYALFFLAESLAARGQSDAALNYYGQVSRQQDSRFANTARWRAADVQWLAGRKPAAAAAYRKLLEAKTPGGDKAQAWTRVAEHAASEGSLAAATDAYEKVMVDFPTHRLAAAAEAELTRLDPAPAAGTGGQALPAPDALSPALRIERAQRLSDKRRWNDAIAELERLKQVPPELVAQRDFVLGQAKYRSRKDYPAASVLLARAATALQGKQAAWAAFHAARALSRADQDAAAIKGYLQFVKAYPQSEFAAEAQFLAGWLDFNQGKFREAVPALTATTRSFARTPFAADAAWYLTLVYYFLEDHPRALSFLADFDARTQTGSKNRIWPQDRVVYWRARILERMQRREEARALYVQLVKDEPLRWYGLLAAQRLREQGHRDPFSLSDGHAPLAPLDRKAKLDPTLQKVDELLAAGLRNDAGYELESAADALIKRLGKEKGLAAVIDRSTAAGVYAKAYRLADVLGAPALSTKPEGDVKRIWQAVYPLAYRSLVDRFSAAAGNPDHYLYSIMHKESGFDPRVISYADARGLLQMIPPTSRKVAENLGLKFADDALLDPEVNIRLGASYIGSLYKKFTQQVPLAAGAYNAGPGAMMRWLDRHGEHPLDEFVELVAYEQTREYIKRVTGIYARYRYLYAGDRYLPALQVQSKYTADGPNF